MSSYSKFTSIRDEYFSIAELAEKLYKFLVNSLEEKSPSLVNV